MKQKTLPLIVQSFSKDEPKNPSRGPDLGEHSKEILSGIGIDSNELDKLKEDGIIDF